MFIEFEGLQICNSDYYDNQDSIAYNIKLQ